MAKPEPFTSIASIIKEVINLQLCQILTWHYMHGVSWAFPRTAIYIAIAIAIVAIKIYGKNASVLLYLGHCIIGSTHNQQVLMSYTN